MLSNFSPNGANGTGVLVGVNVAVGVYVDVIVGVGVTVDENNIFPDSTDAVEDIPLLTVKSNRWVLPAADDS